MNIRLTDSSCWRSSTEASRDKSAWINKTKSSCLVFIRNGIVILSTQLRQLSRRWSKNHFLLVLAPNNDDSRRTCGIVYLSTYSFKNLLKVQSILKSCAKDKINIDTRSKEKTLTAFQDTRILKMKIVFDDFRGKWNKTWRKSNYVHEEKVEDKVSNVNSIKMPSPWLANITETWSSKIVAQMPNEIREDGSGSLATATKRLPLRQEVSRVKGKSRMRKNLLTRSEIFFFSFEFNFQKCTSDWIWPSSSRDSDGAEMYAEQAKKYDQIIVEINFPSLSWSASDLSLVGHFFSITRFSRYARELFGAFYGCVSEFEICLCSPSMAGGISFRSKNLNGLTARNFRSILSPQKLRPELEFIDLNGPFRHS